MMDGDPLFYGGADRKPGLFHDNPQTLGSGEEASAGAEPGFGMGADPGAGAGVGVGTSPSLFVDIEQAATPETRQEAMQEAPQADPNIKWYVIHTYSGYENKVKANIEKIVENQSLQELILDVVVPMEEQIEIKDGRKKATLRKVFPGYVLLKMIMCDHTWYVVRNTRGVTGFVGPGSKPVPLSEEEVQKLGVDEFLPVLDYEVGDNVRVAAGPLENFIGIVEDINMEKKKVRVLVSMFGRETPVELELAQIQKL